MFSATWNSSMLPPSPAHTRASWKGVVQWRMDEEGRGGWLWWWGDSDAATVMKSAPRKKRSKGYHHNSPPLKNTFVQCISHTDGGLWSDGIEERKCLSEYTKECSERGVKCSTSSHSPATERVCGNIKCVLWILSSKQWKRQPKPHTAAQP